MVRKKKLKLLKNQLSQAIFRRQLPQLSLPLKVWLTNAESSTKEQYHLIVGQAYLGAAGNDYEKLNMAATSFENVLSINKNSKYATDATQGLEEVGIALINSAQLDQKNQKYIEGSKKI